jgi:hypothetical protein
MHIILFINYIVRCYVTPRLEDRICFKTIQLYSNDYPKGKYEDTRVNGIIHRRL